MASGIELIERIDTVLNDMGISRKQFASEINIQTNTMGNWKSNNSMPPADTIVILARHLNVSTDWLLNGNPSFEERESALSHHSREQVRSRIYKRLIEKFKITENTDNLKQLHHDWFDPGYESYEYLLNWSKGRNEIDHTTFVSWANSLDTTVQYLFTGEQSEMPAYFDKYTYEVAMENQNDLFCLHNLSGDRKQAAHIMLNQFMKVEHLEHVEKNKKDNQ